MAKKAQGKERITARTIKSVTGSVPRRKALRVGRNQPCPCGSGKKYKDCHQSEGDTYLQSLAHQEAKAKRLKDQRRRGAPWYRRLWTRLVD